MSIADDLEREIDNITSTVKDLTIIDLYNRMELIKDILLSMNESMLLINRETEELKNEINDLQS